MGVLLRPDEYHESVLDIDPRDIAARGYKAVLLDIDNTIMSREEETISAPIMAWLDAVSDAGLEKVFVSNSFKQRSVNASEQAGALLIGKAMKPFTRGYREACEKLGIEFSQAVMIGDQTYTDIFGANLCGVRSIYVEPLSKVDLVHTKFFRVLDKLFLVGMRPKKRG